ncbi:hypothetical protein ACTFQT_19345 [Bacillus cereus group sp. MYBK32-1]|nr:hypothetical protein [Priestia aryabhattai]KYQ03957.1 hypothetical protein B4079_0882 [Bacillus cereus]KZD73324.1 hypothetical protein B4155_5588 [Bacillus cereus]KZD74687.1 hypothetical protein B4120_4117 [Bacillus cereus]MDA2312475.1 hypothetical protein [Bacillus cereus]
MVKPTKIPGISVLRSRSVYAMVPEYLFDATIEGFKDGKTVQKYS